ncbi:DUF4406 domain-containing protein [Clostridium cellulovorans]|uniref:DUF4406 domain-containing protein n=1 Tax=Clostridium cellulovorans (strain ATCC 35296 / DSM 3052 / OCM 3 / 743B) TaxID=573061 RepID=D9SWF2_CLOC7|nr:DUF4406 domain-containing protein [Clostridium cellulovorans]ADL53234.1 hypothetical protein Clocel_3558 [Clostridium cellulovorans 743B]
MSKKMKVYIAGKITGLPDYKENFAEVEEKLIKEGHLVMNPAILPEGFPWEAYMPICYAMIDACDTVCMLGNWIDSKGARMEYVYAKKQGKVLMFEVEDTNEITDVHIEEK